MITAVMKNIWISIFFWNEQEFWNKKLYSTSPVQDDPCEPYKIGFWEKFYLYLNIDVISV